MCIRVVKERLQGFRYPTSKSVHRGTASMPPGLWTSAHNMYFRFYHNMDRLRT